MAVPSGTRLLDVNPDRETNTQKLRTASYVAGTLFGTIRALPKSDLSQLDTAQIGEDVVQRLREHTDKAEREQLRRQLRRICSAILFNLD
jgi:hypothetical protein